MMIEDQPEEEKRENCCSPLLRRLRSTNVNRRLLTCKLFYFFFWSAYGSFFPLLGVYFKQIGMNPTQSGILVGCRPLIEFVSAPSLSSLADRLRIRKFVMLFNIIIWMSFVFPFAFIKPADNTCHRYILLSKNITELTSVETSEVQDLLKGNMPADAKIEPHRKGKVVFSEESVHQVFLVLLFLTLVGEFFASSAPTLADSATLTYLGDDKEKYGRQRMFGSLGWGAAMLTVGFVIDGMPKYEACGVKISSDYTYAFYFFLGYMMAAFLVTTQFSFKETDSDDEIIDGTPKDVLKLFLTPKYLAVVFAAFYAGLGMGLTRVFLFWHLEDLGAPPMLFGISSAVDHGAETMTYFVIERVIHVAGHMKILYACLFVNFIRFTLISFLTNPWLILPLDILQGFAHAAIWASLTSYLSRAAPKGYRSAVQGILQGFYFGLGRAVGAMGGGLITHYFSTEKSFRMYGIGSLPVLLLLLAVMRLTSRTQEEAASHKREEPQENCPVSEKEGKSEQTDNHPSLSEEGQHVANAPSGERSPQKKVGDLQGETAEVLSEPEEGNTAL